MSGYGVLDLEYVGEPWDGKLLCVGWRDRAYTPETIPRGVLDELADPQIAKVVFTKADHRWLGLAGYEVAGPILDVQVLAWIVNETTDLSLEACALRYSNIRMDKRIERRGGNLYFRTDEGKSVPLEQLWRCGDDVRALPSGVSGHAQGAALVQPVLPPDKLGLPQRAPTENVRETRRLDAESRRVSGEEHRGSGGVPTPCCYWCSTGRARPSPERRQDGQSAGEFAASLPDGSPAAPPCSFAQLILYCERDLAATEALMLDLKRALEYDALVGYWRDYALPLTPVLVGMETRGVPVDMDASERLRETLEAEMQILSDELHDEALLPDDFNLGSNKQLAQYLYQTEFEVKATRPIPPAMAGALKSIPRPERAAYVNEAFPMTGFVVGKVGRTYLHGIYTLPGLGLKVRSWTETGEPSVAAKVLRVHYGDMPWIAKLLELKKRETIVETFLRSFRDKACNQRGENYGSAKERIAPRPTDVDSTPDNGRDILAAEPPDASIREQARSGVSTSLDRRKEDGPVSVPPGTSAVARRSSSPPRRESGEQRAREPRRASTYAARGDSLLRPDEHELGAFRLYGRFSQTGTKTGRLSSQTPNLQNIPSRGSLGIAVRELFRPEPGFVFVHGDYSMLEPRLMAHFSQDPVLLDIFRTGKDIYLETANRVLGGDFHKGDRERELFKTYILAMGYGAGAEKLGMTLAEAGFPTQQKDVGRTLAGLKDVYARFFEWKEEVIATASEERYVSTLSGHRRRLGNETAAAGWRDIGTGDRQAVNAVIQGSAADIVAQAMVNVERRWAPTLRLLVQVHDELLWEARRGIHLAEPELLGSLRAIAENGHGFELSVPLVFEPHVVPTWAAGKE